VDAGSFTVRIGRSAAETELEGKIEVASPEILSAK
jgi:hypothetical protein